MKQSMYKYSVILLLFILTYNHSTAQISRYIRVVQKNFNWGVRAGFNATNYNLYQIYQNDTEINGDIINQTGFQCAFFGKTNIGKFFFQPDFSYFLTREKYQLGIPVSIDIDTGQEIIKDITLEKSSQSLSAATLFGYNVYKSDACLFNLLLGPNFIFNHVNKYKAKYEITESFEDKNLHYKLNLVTGVSANISHFYLDFRYELNLPSKNDIHFSDVENLPNYLKDISIRKTRNIISFSMGVMF